MTDWHFFYIIYRYPNGDENGAVWMFAWNDQTQTWMEIDGPLEPSNSEPQTEFGYVVALSADAKVNLKQSFL